MIHFSDIYYKRSTQQIMLLVVLACIPGISIQFYYFGYGVLLQILISLFIAVCSELIIIMIRGKSVKYVLTDHSAIVTSLLFSISLPPLLPFWLNAIGTFFAIVIAKQLYGGLGQNIFNPAMVGYVFLLISSPILMTNFKIPCNQILNSPNLIQTVKIIFYNNQNYNDSFSKLILSNNNLTQATPLDKFKTEIYLGKRHKHKNDCKDLFMLMFFNFSKLNYIETLINMGYFLGGVFLLWMNIICWRIPFSFLFTLIFLSILGYFYDSEGLISPLINLFSGATMLGAFFIATDPVTIPATKIGRVIFGILTGFLVWLIRDFGGYPDSIAFSILISNITVPLMEYYTAPKVYGYDKE